MRRICIFSGILISVIILNSCGTARRSEPLMGPMSISSEKVARGKVVFDDKCSKCHPAGEGGVGPPINNIYLPEPLLKFRVRSKAFVLGLGKMPAFKKHDISKQDLDALTAYIKKLRRNK